MTVSKRDGLKNTSANEVHFLLGLPALCILSARTNPKLILLLVQPAQTWPQRFQNK